MTAPRLILRRSISAEKPWALDLQYPDGRGFRTLCVITETVALEIERAGPATFLAARPTEEKDNAS
jgi:hypothetical protein